MSWRDSLFGSATNLIVVGPLTAERLTRLPADFLRWGASADARGFQVRDVGGSWRGIPDEELDARLAAAVVHLPDGLSLAEIAEAIKRRGYGQFAVELVISAPRAALSISHGRSDGVIALEVVRSAFTGEARPADRVSRAPLSRALWRTGQWRPAAILAARSRVHDAHRLLPLAPQVTVGGDHPTRISAFAIASRRISALAAVAATPGERRPSSTAVLSSLLFRSTRRVLADDIDLPVRMQVGMRRMLGPGVTTDGNFAAAPAIGSLRERDWTPGDYLQHVAPRIGSDGVVAEYAFEALSILRARVGSLRGRAASDGSATATVPLSLSFNMLPGGVGVPADDFVAGEPTTQSLTMVVRGGVLGPLLTVAATGREFLVTMTDDSGLIDVAGLEAAVAAEETEMLRPRWS